MTDAQQEEAQGGGLGRLVSCSVITALVIGLGFAAKVALAPSAPQMTIRPAEEGSLLEVEGHPAIPLVLGPECSEPRIEPGKVMARLSWIARGSEVAALLYLDEEKISVEAGGTGPALARGEALVLLPNGQVFAIDPTAKIEVEVLEGQLGEERAKVLIYSGKSKSQPFTSPELLVNEAPLPLLEATSQSFGKNKDGWEWLITINKEVYDLLKSQRGLNYSRVSKGRNLGTVVLESKGRQEFEDLVVEELQPSH